MIFNSTNIIRQTPGFWKFINFKKNIYQLISDVLPHLNLIIDNNCANKVFRNL